MAFAPQRAPLGRSGSEGSVVYGGGSRPSSRSVSPQTAPNAYGEDSGRRSTTATPPPQQQMATGSGNSAQQWAIDNDRRSASGGQSATGTGGGRDNDSRPRSHTNSNQLYLQSLLYYDRGDYQRARSSIEETLSTLRDWKDQLNPNPTVAEKNQTHLLFSNAVLLYANIMASLGQLDVAQDSYAACEGYLIEHLGPKFIGVATCRLNLAVALLSARPTQNPGQSQTQKATSPRRVLSPAPVVAEADGAASLDYVEDLLLSCVPIVENEFGRNRLVLADVYHNLGVCRFHMKSFCDSLEYFLKSMRIREKMNDLRGDVDHALVLTMTSLATILTLQNQHTEAAEILSAAIAIQELHFGPISLQLADTLMQYGVTLAESGKLQLAKEQFSRSVNIKGEVLGEEDPETLDAVSLLCSVERRIMRNQEVVAQRGRSGWYNYSPGVGPQKPLRELHPSVHAETSRSNGQDSSSRQITPTPRPGTGGSSSVTISVRPQSQMGHNQSQDTVGRSSDSLPSSIHGAAAYRQGREGVPAGSARPTSNTPITYQSYMQQQEAKIGRARPPLGPSA